MLSKAIGKITTLLETKTSECHLSSGDRKAAIRLADSGPFQRAIGSQLNFRQSPVQAVIARYREIGDYRQLSPFGRPPILDDRARRRLSRDVLQARRALLAGISNKYGTCPSTARHELGSMGVLHKVAISKPSLPAAQMQNRLPSCKERVQWNESQWHNIIWSDEASVEIGEPGARLGLEMHFRKSSSSRMPETYLQVSTARA